MACSLAEEGFMHGTCRNFLPDGLLGAIGTECDLHEPILLKDHT